MNAGLSTLKIRTNVIRATREFFESRGYLEVETPILSASVIPEAHIDPERCGDRFLLASPELYMKQLLAKGASKIFQICKCFRKDERGARHLPELTLLEWYARDQTYEDLMEQCESLIRHIAERTGKKGTLPFQGRHISLSAPFDRISVTRAFERHAKISVNEAMKQDRFDEVLSFEVEPRLGLERPCFLADYPAPLASLSKLHPDTPELAQRFELYVAGLELANGFTELTDPQLQRQRFLEENRIRQSRSLAPLPMPEAFLSALEHMPEAAGIALGMDRLVMLVCDAASIDEVVAFTPDA